MEAVNTIWGKGWISEEVRVMQFVHDNNRRSFLWRGVCSLLIVCQFNFIFYQFLKYIFDFFKSLTMKCVLQLPTRFWPLACR